MAFDAEGRLVVHEVAGVRIWPAGPIADQPAPSLHRLPDMKGSLFNMPRIARTPDGRIMALLRSQSVYLWRSDAPDRLIPVIPPPRPAGAPSTALATPPRAAGAPARTDAAAGDAAPLRFRAIQIAPGGSRLYLIDMPGRLHIWDISGSADDAEFRASEPSPGLRPLEGISSLALRRDGAVLAVGDPRIGAVTLFDMARQTVLGSIKLPADEPGSIFLALAFSADGRTLAIGSSQQGTISLYGVDPPDHPRLRLRLPGHRGLVTNLVFDASGNHLASAAGADPLVEVWDLDLIRRELTQRGLAADSP